jgi:hypothetical protein
VIRSNLPNNLGLFAGLPSGGANRTLLEYS